MSTPTLPPTPAHEISAEALPAAYTEQVKARLEAEARAARWKMGVMDAMKAEMRLQTDCRAYEHLLQDIACRLEISSLMQESLLPQEYGPLILATIKTWREMLEARYTTPEGDSLFALEQTKREVERLTRELDKAQREREKWRNRAKSHYEVFVTLARAQGFEGPLEYPDLGKGAQEVVDRADEALRERLARHAPMRDCYEVHTEDGRYYLAVARTVGGLKAVLAAWAEHYDLTGPRKVVVTSPDGARRLLSWSPAKEEGEGEGEDV